VISNAVMFIRRLIKFINWFKNYQNKHGRNNTRLSFLIGIGIRTSWASALKRAVFWSRGSNRLKFIFVNVCQVSQTENRNARAQEYIHLQLIYRNTDQRTFTATIIQVHTGLHAGAHDSVSTQQETSPL
jgi:hypothetical protein